MKVNLRYICQGIMEVAPCDIPKNLMKMSKKQRMAWAKKLFSHYAKVDNALLRGIAQLEPENDTEIGAVEVWEATQISEHEEWDDYKIIAETEEWAAFTAGNRHDLVEE